MVGKLKSAQKGFTIVEVMIVLAIAGLIMLVVLLAVPALQRNSRNTQRKSDAQTVLATLQEVINNNGGKAPSGSTVPTTLSSAKLAQYEDLANNINYNVVTTGAAAALPATMTLNQIAIRNNVKCSSTTTTGTDNVSTTGLTTTTGASLRSYVVINVIETTSGVQSQCQDS